MRKTQKTQIENFLHLLSRAHEEIKKAIASNKKDTALDLLSQCQDGAIQIGETIENLEGENFTTIPLLENYCEVLYQIYENICSNQSINPNKSYKALQKSLNPIKNSVKNEIKVQIEAVFLPYKASMWDSLESIWQAADEDPDCDAYVIPIPYYDKNPDGSFKEMHYEGDLYPDYVPITDYQAYDFQERCPDMIFIHNPYDECNYVTSVHPFFYSKNLKQFTEKLVYVPYFVLDEIDPENQSAIEGMKHFCTVPGVIYADKVIVQSEDMRQIYVNVLTEYAKGSQANRKYWEDKILGLGSPKIDKVLSTRKEDIEIPEEWRRVIEKADGSFKKVIFYNTSVTAFLEHEEQYLKKMEDVFKVFKEAKEEIALLWRPHPLMKATIESMRPILWKKYQALMKQYKEEGWGIYDESAEINRAIRLSDAYYGDWSSVVRLCQKVKMPVMIQSMRCGGINWNGLFCTYRMVENQGKVWIVTALFNSLFLLNPENGEIEWKGKIPKEKEDVDNLFRDYLIIDNKIYFAPTNAENIIIYDIKTKKYETFELDVRKYTKNENYASAISYGKDIVFIGVGRTNAICRFSMDTKKIVYIESKVNEKIQLKSFGYSYGFRRCIRNNILYIPLLKGGSALKVDLERNSIDILQLISQEDVAFSMAIYIPIKDVIWFVSLCGYIVEWNERLQNKEIIKFSEYKPEIIEEYITYKLDKDRLYLFPRKHGMEYKCIDIYTGRCIEASSTLLEIFDVVKIKDIEYFLGSKKDESVFIGYINKEGLKKEVMVHRKDGKLGKKCLDEYKIHFFTEKIPLYYESAWNGQYGRHIKTYVKWICERFDFSMNIRNTKIKKIGAIIWNSFFL